MSADDGIETSQRRSRRAWLIGGVAMTALAVGAGTAWYRSRPGMLAEK